MNVQPPAEKSSQNQPAAAIEPGFEVAVQDFWARNRNFVLGVCAVALLAIIGREGWQYYTAQHELSVRDDYAKVADRPEQLPAFASANPDHALAGLAYLRVADGKYSAGDFRAAADNYKKAAASLKNPALLGRARVGAAMGLFYAGDKAAGETELKAVANDTALAKGARAEANYHLATLAYEAGNAAEVSRLAAEIGKIDSGGTWAQRATALLTLKAP